MITQLNDIFQINLVDYFKAHAGDFDFGTILKQIFKSLSDLLSNAFIILIYALFIFLEEANFHTKLKAVFADKSQFKELSLVLDQIDKSISSFNPPCLVFCWFTRTNSERSTSLSRTMALSTLVTGLVCFK